jgi:alginate O-acetyltransferase complex protein AlgI
MAALVTALFLFMKVFVYRLWKNQTGRRLPWPRLLLFLFPWPGMRPDAFLIRRPAPQSGFGLWMRYTAVLGAGLLCLGIVHALHRSAAPAWMQIPFLFAGLSLTVHFGLFSLLALALRRAGFAVGFPFLNPLPCRDLQAFWSRRWNRPFVELMTWTVARPLRRRRGRGTALLAGFLASGLLHEVAISLPVQAGYGLPTLYFFLQGSAVFAEHRFRLAEGLPAPWHRLLVWSILLLPLPLVFPPPFVRGVLFPLVGVPW